MTEDKIFIQANKCDDGIYRTNREIELEKKLEIAVNALEDIGYCKSRIMLNYPERLVHLALDALAKIKEIEECHISAEMK